MEDPVQVKGFINDKRNYERAVIQKWLESKKSSPFTLEVLENLPMELLLIPNIELKKRIDEYRAIQIVKSIGSP